MKEKLFLTLTYAGFRGRARLLVAGRAAAALQAGHSLFAGTLAGGLVAGAAHGADGVTIAG